MIKQCFYKWQWHKFKTSKQKGMTWRNGKKKTMNVVSWIKIKENKNKRNNSIVIAFAIHSKSSNKKLKCYIAYYVLKYDLKKQKEKHMSNLLFQHNDRLLDQSIRSQRIYCNRWKKKQIITIHVLISKQYEPLFKQIV